MNLKDYPLYTRWVSEEAKVWEKREWGWKYLGQAKSAHPTHILEMVSIDCDHPDDVIDPEYISRCC